MKTTRRWRHYAAASLVLALATTIAACGSSDETTVNADGKTELRYLSQPSVVTTPELAADLGYFSKVALKSVGETSSGPTSIQAAATGDADFGAAFNGAIVKLASAGSPIKAIVDSYGADSQTFNGFYVLDGSPIRTARDLIGKKVGINTLGAHSEFVIREWLSREGLSKDEIASVQLLVVPPINAESALRQGQIDVGAFSGIFRDRALTKGGLRVLFTDAVFGDFSYGTVVVRTDLITKHPDAVKDFTQGTARAIRWLQVTPRTEVVARFKKILAERGRGEDPELAEYWKSSSIPTPGGVIKPAEFQLWIDWLVRNGELKQGQLKPADLYTNEFNPFDNGTYPPTSGPDGKPAKAAS
ncbi:ABC transporter substrate-binding protein [Gordonia sp. CPCC 205333]|uniref:ABC transporter substrate-binding protein n=1 Tax=Gordonia sp. CPCC 205333 TaxID=3140790 RepID=UPI003AF3CC07